MLAHSAVRTQIRSKAVVRTLVFTIVVAGGPLFGLTACDAAQLNKTSFVEINWTVLGSEAMLNDPYVGRQLKMRIPKEYVRRIYRDSKSEGEKIKGVRNNGIEIISLEAWLPELSPSSPLKNMNKQALTQEQIRANDAMRLLIDLNSSFRSPSGTSIREQFVYEAKRKMVYRLPNLYDLERFRRMGCAPGAAFDAAKYDVPRETPPDGCWNLPADEYLIGKDGSEEVWFTCAGPSGRCVIRTQFQSFWNMFVIFSYSRLESWKDVKNKAEKLLNGFVIN